MSQLAEAECVPCQGGVPTIEGADLEAYLDRVDDRWRAVDEHHIESEFEFEDYGYALNFMADVTEEAEEQGHHPELCFTYRTVTVRLWTHAIDGLSENDFIMAARIDEMVS